MAKKKCEGCRKPATTQDVEGINLCQECHDAADHAQSCKCPPCLEKRIEVLAAEVKAWRDGHDVKEDGSGAFIVYNHDGLNHLPEEMTSYMHRLDKARDTTDASGVLEQYGETAAGGD